MKSALCLQTAATDSTKVSIMRVFSERHRLLIALGLVLIAGFATIAALSYFDTRDNLRKGLSEQSLPLTGDAIYAEVQTDLLRPLLIGATIAQDVFLRDWIINGEIGAEQIARYLKEMSAKHGATVFLASERTRQSYAADNTVKSIEQSDARHGWFFQAREMKDPYQISVALDPANRDQTAITVHHRILDQTGGLLGVIGVTMPGNAMVQAIDQYQARLDRNVYFANAQGALVLAAKSGKPAAASLQEHPGMRGIAARLLNGSSKPMQFEYRLDSATMLVNSRFIPELGWYLIVEENTARQVQPARQTLMLSLAIGGATVLLALVIVLLFVNRDQKRMERMASIDPLTGLLNRQAFEIVLEQSMLDVKRSGQPISAILFDIDSFQQVNDKHGHSTGDQILRTIAQLARRVVRDNDIITRWSGTEFLILLRECPLDIAVGVAEKLRNAISSENFGLSSPPQTITTSLGVAQFGFQESQIGFFIRVDKALRDAKTSGRNRTIASVMENQGENIAATLARRG
jgi:diguanylate cyclase (GGDEF)-like protein